MAEVVRDPLVLVVDDFPESVDPLVALLTEQGFMVVLALDGEDGVRQAALLRPLVVVMDLAMPRMDGLEATRRLKALPATRDIPVVLFSAHAGPELGAAADAAGCAAVFRKPVGARAVVELVTRLCRGPAAAATAALH